MPDTNTHIDHSELIYNEVKKLHYPTIVEGYITAILWMSEDIAEDMCNYDKDFKLNMIPDEEYQLMFDQCKQFFDDHKNIIMNSIPDFNPFKQGKDSAMFTIGTDFAFTRNRCGDRFNDDIYVMLQDERQKLYEYTIKLPPVHVIKDKKFKYNIVSM